MLIKDNVIRQSSVYPNTNWLDDDSYYLIDETTEEGKVLAKKAITNTPYIELVIDENENVIDIIPTESPEPKIVDEPVDEEKVAMAEAIVDLEMRLSKLEQGGSI